MEISNRIQLRLEISGPGCVGCGAVRHVDRNGDDAVTAAMARRSPKASAGALAET
jgi:hypothetical protein